MTPLRVGIDATSWGNRRGFGRFARNAVGALVAGDGGAEYVLYTDGQTARDGTFPPAADVVEVELRRAPTEAASAGSQRPFRDLLKLTRAVSRGGLDVMLFPSVYTWFPVLRAPTVVGVHDVIADEHPELTLPSRAARTRWRLKRGLATRRATTIFTVSDTSRAALGARLGIDEATIAVVPEAPDPVFGPRSPSAIESELAPLGLSPGATFLLYAGGISPHKDVQTLLTAFAELDAPAARLVVAGALEDETYLSAAGDVRRTIDELRLHDRVLLPGHVSDETLACLYACARAFVSPSKSEGFGLPAVEAATSGTAVVLSDIPAHRETLGDAALYFTVGDARALREHLERLLSDDAFREAQASAARARVAGLTWDAAGAALRELVTRAARG